MNKKELLSRISIDPDVCFGKPCIRGHRIWVSLVLDLLSSGWTVQQVLEQYPGIEETDVLACIAYGAEMSRERYVDIPLGDLGLIDAIRTLATGLASRTIEGKLWIVQRGQVREYQEEPENG